MDRGYWKFHRDMDQWQHFRDNNTFKLFICLLNRASHKKLKLNGVVLNPGQLIFGRISFAEYTGLSEQSIRTSLKKLEDSGEIKRKRLPKCSIITICNWLKYQDERVVDFANSPNQVLTTHKNANIHTDKKENQEEVKTKTTKQNSILNNKLLRKHLTPELAERLKKQKESEN